MGQLDDVNDTYRIQKLATPIQKGYREAFIAQTGLMPDRVAMMYGEEIVEEHGKLVKKFMVRFVPKDTATELKGLLSEIEALQVKNSAMQLVIAPLSNKAGISNEAMIELLKAAEAQVLEKLYGKPQNEAAGWDRDAAL